jgi:hypothetical protein
MAAHPTKPWRDQRRVGQYGDADRSIKAVADHVDRRVAQVQIDRYLLIFGEEFRQQRGEVQDPKRHGRAASRTRPRTADERASASSSAASPSARMFTVRSDSCRPAGVSAIRRDVRLNNRVLSFASTLLTAFETVPLESFSSAAAAAKERVSATLANYRQAFEIGQIRHIKSGND